MTFKAVAPLRLEKEIEMLTWFYATLTEPAGWYSTAVRARDIASARRVLARRYPHATVLSLTR